MDDLPTTAVSPGAPQPEQEPGLTRREFMLLAAFAGSGALLLLSRCRPPFAPGPDGEVPLVIPPEFKRFMLVVPLPEQPYEQRIVALGSQCPDLACALWWADTQDFEFFDRVEQIEARYARTDERNLIWLD